jgi:PadR family transcriptional regulator
VTAKTKTEATEWSGWAASSGLTPSLPMPIFLGMDLRGHLDLLLLGTLRQTGPAHGYALIAGLRERSLGAFDLPEGTVYPALHRLERDGLVSSEWDTTAPRRRRVYQLTPAGAAALAAKHREWRTFARGVQAIVGRSAVEGLG